MMNQRSSNEKQTTCGIRLQVVPQTRGSNLQDLQYRHAALPHLQDGVANSEKANWITVQQMEVSNFN